MACPPRAGAAGLGRLARRVRRGRGREWPGAPLPGGTTASFRVYYLGGALLTAPLLGAGSLLLAGVRAAKPVALVVRGPRARRRARHAGRRGASPNRGSRRHRRSSTSSRPASWRSPRTPPGRSRSSSSRSSASAGGPLGNGLILAGVGNGRARQRAGRAGRGRDGGLRRRGCGAALRRLRRPPPAQLANPATLPAFQNRNVVRAAAASLTRHARQTVEATGESA